MAAKHIINDVKKDLIITPVQPFCYTFDMKI